MKSSRSTLLLGAIIFAGLLSAWQPVVAQGTRITAREVLDRETLKAFVQAAKAHVEGLTESGRIDEFLEEPWKFGSVYIYISNDEGVIRWHGANPASVDQDLSGLEDQLTGALFAQELIAAAKAGGGYVEYHFDDPTVIGDEDHTSPKLGYVETFTSPLPDLFSDQNMIIGSGIYLGHQIALDFAHFGNGSAITSDIVLVNLAATPILPAVYFYDEMGQLLDPESVVDISEDLQTTAYGAVTLESELAALSEVTISTNGMGETVTGSVKVISDGPHSPIGGVLRFDIPHIGVAGVGASQPVRDAIFPARRQAGGIDTGAALRNLSEKELMLICHLMMGGEVMEEAEVKLAANGQDAMFISEMFEYDTSDFTGSVRCTASGIAQKFTGVAVELDDMNDIFTTLPVIPLEGEMPSMESMASEE
ncbi:MAG: cache domain-containing protein [Acidobacteriota bacterium]|nr:cache domain-containing protein [Acidobacteriota bacterium]